MFSLDPSSEQELQEFLKNGHVQESHFLDFKADLEDGKSGNKSIAKDIASFAIDGGMIVYGVSEKPNGFELNPIEVQGVSERIEQIALSSITPPVSIRTKVLLSPEREGNGYVLVYVPATEVSPHMVDGRFMAREDKTQRALTHPEVLRFHEMRFQNEISRQSEIKKQISRDPVPADCRVYPHLHLTATPRLSAKPLFLGTLREESPFNVVRAWLKESAANIPRMHGDSSESFASVLGQLALRHDGIALYSGNLTRNRAFERADARFPEKIAELEITQDGQLRFFNGMVGFPLGNTGNDGPPSLFPRWVLRQVREFVALAGIAARHVEFGGRWDFSVGITGISNMAISREHAMAFDVFKYENGAPDYIAHASGDLHSIESNPGELTGDLLGRFIRSIEMETYYKIFFE